MHQHVDAGPQRVLLIAQRRRVRMDHDAVPVRLVDDRVVHFVRHRGIASAPVAQPDLDAPDALGSNVLHRGTRFGRAYHLVVGVQRPGPLDQDLVWTALGRHNARVEEKLSGGRKLPCLLVRSKLERDRHRGGPAVVGGSDAVKGLALQVVEQVLGREIPGKRLALSFRKFLVA